MYDDDRKMADLPQGMAPLDAACQRQERKPSLQRKEELFQLAKAIAAQVGPLTKHHERCLLRHMVELLLDG